MFKKNKKQTETIKEPKEKKVRTVKVGTHKKTVIALWVVLVDSSKILIHSKAHACDKHHPQRNHGFLTKELQGLNVDTIRTDIPTSSTVTDVIVWSIEQSGTDTFSATYEVDQQIKEGEQTSNVKATYTVKVYVDADGNMVIVQNPTLAPAIEKSDYEPKTPEPDASVDADTVNDATAFLVS